MRTTAAAGTAQHPSRARARDRLRRLWSKQMQLWDRTLDDLEPWRQEGQLRWRGKRLDGTVLNEASRQSARSTRSPG